MWAMCNEKACRIKLYMYNLIMFYNKSDFQKLAYNKFSKCEIKLTLSQKDLLRTPMLKSKGSTLLLRVYQLFSSLLYSVIFLIQLFSLWQIRRREQKDLGKGHEFGGLGGNARKAIVDNLIDK